MDETDLEAETLSENLEILKRVMALVYISDEAVVLVLVLFEQGNRWTEQLA